MFIFKECCGTCNPKVPTETLTTTFKFFDHSANTWCTDVLEGLLVLLGFGCCSSPVVWVDYQASYHFVMSSCTHRPVTMVIVFSEIRCKYFQTGTASSESMTLCKWIMFTSHIMSH
eukprot:scpid68773/ scgid33857/ 